MQNPAPPPLGSAPERGGLNWLAQLFAPSAASAVASQRAGLQASTNAQQAGQQAQQASQQAQQAAQRTNPGFWRAPSIFTPPAPFVAPLPVQPPPMYGNGGIGPPSFVPPPNWIPQAPPAVPPPTVTFSSTSYQVPCNLPLPPTIRI